MSSRLTLVNISASPLTVDVFNYLDLDVCGSASGDSATGGLNSHVVTDIAQASR